MIMTTRKRHSPEWVVRKLTSADRLVAYRWLVEACGIRVGQTADFRRLLANPPRRSGFGCRRCARPESGGHAADGAQSAAFHTAAAGPVDGRGRD